MRLGVGLGVHTIFETHGLGIYSQLIGFLIGTNCAPTWANLVFRFYERVHNVVDMMLFRLTDDGLVLHPEEDEKAFLAKLQAPYPALLRVGMECFNPMQPSIYGFVDCEIATFENKCIFQANPHVFIYSMEL